MKGSARRSARAAATAPFRVFVTATDTGVGKTQVSCALLELLARRGLEPAPFKPYETGCDDLDAPADALAMREAAGARDPLSRICPHRFRLPLAPWAAARRERRTAPLSKTLAAYRQFGARPVVVEGAGGLRVPVEARLDMIDLIARLKLPAVLVARAGLGTLNHTALSLEALRRRRIPVLAVVLSQSVPQADPSMDDNAELIAARHRVRVLGPVAHEPDAGARRAAFQRALEPLLQR